MPGKPKSTVVKKSEGSRVAKPGQSPAKMGRPPGSLNRPKQPAQFDAFVSYQGTITDPALIAALRAAMDRENDELLTPAAAAKFMKISEWLTRRLISDGVLRAVYVGALLRVRVGDLRACIAKLPAYQRRLVS